jgi:hypothetical protein
MHEKRKYRRISINQIIELSIGKERILQARGVNVSEGGILFQAASELELYSRLFVMFTIPEGDRSESLTVEGFVVRSDKSGAMYDTAMEFADINEKNNILLKSYIRNTKK